MNDEAVGKMFSIDRDWLKRTKKVVDKVKVFFHL